MVLKDTSPVMVFDAFSHLLMNIAFHHGANQYALRVEIQNILLLVM